MTDRLLELMNIQRQQVTPSHTPDGTPLPPFYLITDSVINTVDDQGEWLML